MSDTVDAWSRCDWGISKLEWVLQKEPKSNVRQHAVKPINVIEARVKTMRIKKIRWFISVGVFVLVVPVIVIRGLPVPGMGMQYGVLETQYEFAPAPEPTEEEKRQNHFEQFSREYKRRMNQSP